MKSSIAPKYSSTKSGIEYCAKKFFKVYGKKARTLQPSNWLPVAGAEWSGDLGCCPHKGFFIQALVLCQADLGSAFICLY
jgi:hypothetical protein